MTAPKTIGKVINPFPHLENKDLPRFPIAELKPTFDKYLRTIRAIASDEEYANTERLVREFESSEEVQRLHEKLHKLDKQSPTSWIEGLWDTMYLEGRGPVVVHVSPYYAIKRDEKRCSQISRTAALIESCVHFHDTIRDGSIEPDMERTVKLDMSQYGKLLGGTRVPKPGRDIYTDCTDGKTVIVACNKQFYELKCRDENGKAIPEGELLVHLEAIVQDAHNYIENVPVGVLTADDRDSWAAVHSELLTNAVNKVSLKAIQDSLLVFCLDDQEPSSLTEFSKTLMHGDSRNRWFDKSVQIIVAKNGEAGINMEHSRFDGHSILKLTEFIYKNSTSREVAQPQKGVQPVLGKLKWSLSPKTVKHVEEAEKRVDALTESVDSHVVEFTRWGKGLIKKCKVSPDAFVQMAYQLAYYRLRGQPGSTYESGNAKRFYHGRTTCIRSCSVDSVNFTKLFCDAHSTKEQKEEALRKAIDHHVQLSRDAKVGKDVDRLLFGLYYMARFEQQKFPNREIPKIFKDPLYSRMKTDMLSSSSSSGSPCLTMFGFGPTSAAGFGIGYVINENYINVDVTSFTGESKQYAEALEQAFIDMAEVLSK